MSFGLYLISCTMLVSRPQYPKLAVQRDFIMFERKTIAIFLMLKSLRSHSIKTYYCQLPMLCDHNMDYDFVNAFELVWC